MDIRDTASVITMLFKAISKKWRISGREVASIATMISIGSTSLGSCLNPRVAMMRVPAKVLLSASRPKARFHDPVNNPHSGQARTRLWSKIPTDMLML